MQAVATEISTDAAPACAAQSRGAFWLGVNAATLLAVALVLRGWRLENIPGINGDEAWSGVQAARMAAGEAIGWRTPSGNPINLFFLLPLAALHTVLAPSFTLLRSVALVSGIAALVANYLLCRRAFDARMAIVSTLLLALLPINIAYSRFAWDASQSLLATVLVLYLPLSHYRKGYETTALPVRAMIALGAAVLVHPTNVFAAPLVVVPIVYGWRHRIWCATQEVAVPAKPLVLGLLAVTATALAFAGWHVLAGAASVGSPGDLAAFLQNYVRLFSGATVYEYIAGVNSALEELWPFAWLPATCTIAFAVAIVFGAWGMVRRLADDRDPRDLLLVIGWGAMLVGFFLVAGPRAIAPHYERYGICLIAPGVMLLARGLALWIEPWQPHARLATWVLVASVWLYPATFYLGYFDFIERTGGCSHLAFRTAGLEPKLAALRYITAKRDAGRPVRIEANAWWNYWPLAYLARGEKNLHVVSNEDPQSTSAANCDLRGEQVFSVEFADQPEHDARTHSADSGNSSARHVIDDALGRAVLAIEGPAENSLQKY